MSTLNLDPQSSGWLVRLAISWYAYWRKDNEKQFRYGRQENLCHFVRVLVFWAPTKWIFTHRYGKWFRPWMGILLAMLLTALVLGLISYPTETLGILAGIGIAILIISAIIFLIYASEFHSRTFRKIVKIVFFPIWWPVYALATAGVWIFNKLGDLGVDRPFAWFFSHEIRDTWVRPWMIAILLGYITLLLHPVTQGITWIVTLTILATLVIIVSIFAAIFGIGKLWDNYKKAHHYQNPIEVLTEKPVSSLRFAFEAVKTFKHNTICPYIRIKGYDN